MKSCNKQAKFALGTGIRKVAKCFFSKVLPRKVLLQEKEKMGEKRGGGRKEAKKEKEEKEKKQVQSKFSFFP